MSRPLGRVQSTVNLHDAITLVSRLQALLVQEDFYSTTQCTIIGLFCVSLLVLCHWNSTHSENTNRNHNITVGILLLSLLNN